jgi:hypothetical protein
MSHRYFRAAMLGALVLTGCATQPTAPTSSLPTSDEPEVSAAYAVAAAHFGQIEIQGLSASSTSVRDTRWWGVENATDHNTHSAWKPSDDAAVPELTLELGTEQHVTAIAIKLDDHPITFDVSAWVDGAWRVVATEARPARYQVLDAIEIPDVTTSRLKLTFHHVGDPTGSTVGEPPNQRPVPARVSVCEVRAFTDQAPPTSPSPLPTQAPGGATCVRLVGSGTQFTDDGRNGFTFTFRTGITAENGILGGFSVASTAGHTGERFDVTSITNSASGDEIVLKGRRDGYAPETAVVTVHVTGREGDTLKGYVSRFQLDNDVASIHYDLRYGATGMEGGESFTRPSFVEETLDACGDGPVGCMNVSGKASLNAGDGYDIDAMFTTFVSTELGGFGNFYFYNHLTHTDSLARVEHVAIEGDVFVSTGRFDDMVVDGDTPFRHGTYRLEVDRATGAIKRLVQTLDTGVTIDAAVAKADPANGHLSFDQDCAF